MHFDYEEEDWEDWMIGMKKAKVKGKIAELIQFHPDPQLREKWADDWTKVSEVSSLEEMKNFQRKVEECIALQFGILQQRLERLR